MKVVYNQMWPKRIRDHNTGEGGGAGGELLEQRINERTLNSVFQISVKTTHFCSVLRVFFEKLPLFTAFLILTTLNIE